MTLTIPENDHGHLYIFEVEPELAALSPSVATLADRLGAPHLNPDFVDYITVEDLPDSGVAWYLREGYGVTPTARQEAAIRTVPSHLLLVMSHAFDGAEVVLPAPDGLRHVVTLTQPAEAASFDPLTSKGAKGTLAGATPPPVAAPQRPSRVYLYALILIFAFFGLMAWRIASGNV